MHAVCMEIVLSLAREKCEQFPLLEKFFSHVHNKEPVFAVLYGEEIFLERMWSIGKDNG